MAPRLLWTPSPARIERAAVTGFARERGLPENYDALWRWSVEHLEEFWAAIWEHFGVEGSYERVLGSDALPGAQWFPDARVSYPAHLFAGKPDDRVAIHHASEAREPGSWTWGRLRGETARIRAGLQRLGVGEGDRVAAFLPNV